MIGRMELEQLPRSLGGRDLEENVGSSLGGCQIEKTLNDSIWRKLRFEWVEGCNRSSKLHYWAGMCGDLVNKEWQDGARSC